MLDYEAMTMFLIWYCLHTVENTDLLPGMITVLGSATDLRALFEQLINIRCCLVVPRYKRSVVDRLKEQIFSRYSESDAYREEPFKGGKIVYLVSTSGSTLCSWFEYPVDHEFKFEDLDFITFIETFGSNYRPLTIASGNSSDYRFYRVVYLRLIQRFGRERAREMVEHLTLRFSGEDNRDVLYR